jgi:hypothetical protein
VLDGSVISQCKSRHRHQKFLGFLNRLDHGYRGEMSVAFI